MQNGFLNAVAAGLLLAAGASASSAELTFKMSHIPGVPLWPGIASVLDSGGPSYSDPRAPRGISAASAIIMDAQSGKILWEKDAHTLRFPASTTKILTALILLEKCTLDEVIIAPAGVEKVTGAGLRLKPGEKINVRDMLHAIMLRSANDGCEAAAVHVAGSVAEFSKLMNERAKQIGCKNTHFNNPHGLNDDTHVTTAFDLALMAREAMKYPLFREIAAKRKATITRSIGVKDSTLVSKNRYLDLDPTADGIKTGWTIPAGRCYVGSVTRNGQQIITVVLKSENWMADHAAMIEWAFAHHEQKLVMSPTEAALQVPIRYGSEYTVPASVAEEVRQVVNRSDPARLEIIPSIHPELEAPIRQGQEIGYVTLRDSQGWSETYPLLALTDIERSTPRTLQYLLFVGGVGTGAMWLRRRKRRLRKSHRRTAARSY
jgi:serine-type D-Ala-D-Ala carboxypeptidase (penicillin-binding protein 5/6)